MRNARWGLWAGLVLGCTSNEKGDDVEFARERTPRDAAAPSYCSPGDTRVCVGAGACTGGQRCEDDERWGDCDCGSEERDGGPQSQEPDMPGTVMPQGPVPAPASPTTPVVTPAVPPTGSPVTPLEPAVPMTPGPVMPQPTTPGFPSSTFAECGNTDYGSLDSANEDARLPFQSTFFFGDTVTTACTDLAPGQLCLFGEAVSSIRDENYYANWGAGVGLVVAELDADGEVVAPFDATAQGISGFSLRVSQVAGRAVRVLFTEVDSPDVSDASKNFFANAFVWGGSSPMTVSASGEIAVSFSEFALPNWTVIDESLGSQGDPLDPSRLHSLQLQISNSPADVEVPYSFCVSDLVWLDAGVVDPGPDVDELDGGADDDAGFGAR